MKQQCLWWATAGSVGPMPRARGPFATPAVRGQRARTRSAGSFATAQCHASRPEAWRDASHEPSGDASLRGSSAAVTRGFRPKNRLRSQSVGGCPPAPPAQHGPEQGLAGLRHVDGGRPHAQEAVRRCGGHPQHRLLQTDDQAKEQMPKFIPAARSSTRLTRARISSTREGVDVEPGARSTRGRRQAD